MPASGQSTDSRRESGTSVWCVDRSKQRLRKANNETPTKDDGKERHKEINENESSDSIHEMLHVRKKKNKHAEGQLGLSYTSVQAAKDNEWSVQ